jgi:hypothetical protein
MIAAENGHALLVYSLLGKGADVNAQDAQGSTALARASRGGHALVLQALRDAGATDPGGSKPTPLSYERWENCRDKAAASVNAVEVGLGGLRREVERRCGEPPVPAPGAASGLGVRPTELLRSKAWKQKFADVTKGEHQAFVKRLDVASETVFEDGWIVGQGQAPHAGTIDEAALAIDPRTGRVYAAMMVDGKRILGFGFGESWADAPPSLQRWARARGLRESAARP